jgi:hypothetical protein
VRRAQAACLPYSKPLTFEGVVTEGKSYGEDLVGKVGWSHWTQLSLPKPICTIAGGGDDPHSGVSAMQFYSDNHVSDRLRIGQHVKVIGQLNARETADWHTPVYLDIETVR